MINIQNLTYRYEGSHTDSLRGITLSLDRGHIIALMGANGSGKTTLIRCINGLLKPTSGSIMVDGLNVLDEAHLFEIRHKVGMVFQNPDNQIVSTTVEREIAFGLENLELPVETMRYKVTESLRQFHLESYRHMAPHLLSGGERQRLALAAVCVMSPDYLVLDEPTSLLDPRDRVEFFEYIHRYKDEGMGVILVTQSADEALTCDRLIILDSGQVGMDDIPSRVFSEIDKIHLLGVQVPVSFELNAMIEAAKHAH